MTSTMTGTYFQTEAERLAHRLSVIGPTRYVVTHLCKNGERALFQGAQGRYTYERADEAQLICDLFKPSAYARGFKGLEVRPVECWPVHFDPKTIYFDA